MEVEHTATAPRPRTPRIVLRVADPQKFRRDYLHDLADGGVFVKSEKLLPQGSAVDVELHAPGHAEPLPLHGRIDRRVEPGGGGPVGMHVVFEGLDQSVARRLVELVGAFSEEPAPPAAPAAPQAGAAPALASEPWPLPPPAATPGTEPGRPVAAAADRDDGIREVAELRGRLAAAEATIGSLRAELAAHEEDEAGTRALAERLALQKNKLERLRKKEGEEAAAERERLHGELAERTAAAGALETRAADALARAEVEHSARAEAEAAAAEWKARSDATAAEHRETLARAERLAVQVDEAERMALDAEERAADLDTRVHALEAELAGVREAAGEHERRADELAAELAAAGDARREAEARAEELAARLAAVEADRAAAAGHADELAAQLEAARVEQAAERERLGAEAATASTRADEAGAARSRAEEKLRGAEERLGETLARVADLEARLAASEDRLGRLRTKERDLRRLLAVISAKAAEGDEDLAPDAAPDEAGDAEGVVGAIDALEPTAAGTGVIVAADLLAEAGLDVEAPAEIPVDMDLEEPPPGGVDFPSFVARLEAGARVRRTEAFRRYKPSEPSEIRMAGWLVQADGLGPLRELAGAKLPGDRLPRLLFEFYRRGLLELMPERTR